MIAILISFLVFTAYLYFVYRKFGILTSISESFYYIKNRPLFLAWSWLSAIPLLILAQQEKYYFLIAAGTCLVIVGFVSDARWTKAVGFVHGLFAKLAVVFAFASFIFDLGLWWYAILVFVAMAIMYFKKIKNDTYWIEVLAYYAIIIALLIT